ncbi:hypothetical protein DFP72DRAFT_406069 [Ephemerocybe angulata]|uniref:MYND-type domain-containing protein n=1 Tax=Ephemerocybe angulata TaxID=980116 RepID=A0A8H6HX08_9AGAR|nr:hypothetical protein DFP72DRAFT_406069 [Tulosesus angulatus]
MSRAFYPRKRLGERELEILLHGAEGGSLKDLDVLEDNWPTDIKYAKRALEIFLGHLGVTEFIVGSGPSHRSKQELSHKVDLIKAGMGGLDAAFNWMAGTGKRHVAEMFEIFQPHVSMVLACLDFCARHSSIIMTDRVGADPEIFGNNSGATMIKKMLNAFIEHFEKEDGRCALSEIVDFILRSWFRGVIGAPPPERTTKTPQEYGMAPTPLFSALWTCIDEDATRPIILQKVRGFDRKTLRQLADTFEYWCIEWATVHKPASRSEALQLNCSLLAALVSASQELAIVPEFFQALAKSKFATLVLETAIQFRDCPSTRECGGSVATEVASQLFPPRRDRFYELSTAVPELLEAGLLGIIIDDLILPKKKKREPFHRWYSGDPLVQLAKMSHHPSILLSLYSAINSLPQTTLDAISASRVAKEHWETFKASTTLNHEGLEKALAPNTKPAVMCDCLDAKKCKARKSKSDVRPKVKRCSWCYTVAYCSPECQREDWKLLHKYECKTSRYNRIECQLQGAWLSHRSREIYFGLLDYTFGTLIKSIGPPMRRRKRDVWYGNYGADFLPFPMQFYAHTREEILKVRPGGVLAFDDARSRGIIRECDEDERFHLLVCVWKLGQYFVVALGKFEFYEIDKNPGSAVPDIGMFRKLVNGYVKVIQAVPGILGEVRTRISQYRSHPTD